MAKSIQDHMMNKHKPVMSMRSDEALNDCATNVEVVEEVTKWLVEDKIEGKQEKEFVDVVDVVSSIDNIVVDATIKVVEENS